MTILLQVWDLMITDTLNPSKAHLNSFSEVDIQNLIVQSEAERENVRKLLIENIIEKSKNFNREQYVQVHQAMLIRLLDKLYSYINDSRLNKKLLRLYNSIKEHLENTLDFIEDFFNNYFDRNEKVPVTYLTISLEDLCKQLQKLKEINQDVNPELMDVLANNFRNFFKKKNAGITYNQMMYQKDLMNELLAEAPNSESAIKKVLFYFNFNDEDFIAYIYRQLTSLIEPQLLKTEKLTTLRYEQKMINQAPVRLNVHLSPYLPSLKEQVNQWIDEEIKFIEANPLTETTGKSEHEPEEKIHTSLSVAKLALLMRLLVLDKIVTNRIVAHVLRIVVKMFTTLQKESISFGSMETKYHNPDRGTISAVKDMLFRWINILGKL